MTKQKWNKEENNDKSFRNSKDTKERRWSIKSIYQSKKQVKFGQKCITSFL